MSDYEPPAEMVEALSKDVSDRTGYPVHLGERIGKAILLRQHERERRLLEALRTVRMSGGPYCSGAAHDALSAHAKLDAPKVPTLADAVEQIERECPGRVIATLKDSQAWTIIKLAAVEREEKR